MGQKRKKKNIKMTPIFHYRPGILNKIVFRIMRVLFIARTVSCCYIMYVMYSYVSPQKRVEVSLTLLVLTSGFLSALTNIRQMTTFLYENNWIVFLNVLACYYYYYYYSVKVIIVFNAKEIEPKYYVTIYVSLINYLETIWKTKSDRFFVRM